MNLTLVIWRQESAEKPGKFVNYKIESVNENMSFLEMLDLLNEQLTKKGERPVEFDSDCREGICGACGFCINGQAHGPDKGITVCQTHMRIFKDGQVLVLEPWRAKAFPIIKDLVVDRSAFDRIIQSGGYISAKTGPQPDANATLIQKGNAERAMDAAACIGCGACVAACPNASASLFTAAKISQFTFLPQGQIERKERALNMVKQMDNEYFGNCTNIGECETACPKEISIQNIAIMKREFACSLTSDRSAPSKSDGHG